MATNLDLVHDVGPTEEWVESGSIADGVVLTFHGINQDVQDRLDAENFVRGLKTSERPDPDYEAIMFASHAVQGGPRNAHDALRWLLGISFAMFAMFLGGSARLPVIVLFAVPAFFAFGYSLPQLLLRARQRRAAPVRRNVRGAFACTLTPTRFVCSGFHCDVAFELNAMAAFVGDTRLSVFLNDGRTVRLPARIESGRHAPLAARLNDVLRQARALSHGYRGGR